jgi:hypothetical protein
MNMRAELASERDGNDSAVAKRQPAVAAAMLLGGEARGGGAAANGVRAY